MIDVLAIDRWSATGRGWLHRAPPPVKVAALGIVVGVLVAVRGVVPLAVLYGALLVALGTSGLPRLRVLGLSLLPVAMSGIFALTRAGLGWEPALVIVLKGAITSLGMLLLVCTTPHTALLRLGRRWLPATLADLLFLGYRALFVVLGRALAAREALRLRGGRVPWAARLRRGGLIGALAVLRATELATEQYAALRLRAQTPPPRSSPWSALARLARLTRLRARSAGTWGPW